MLVVNRSGIATCSTDRPSGEITVMPPLCSVATQTLPAPSTASESNICKPAKPTSSVPPCGIAPVRLTISPGPDRSKAQTRPGPVSAT